MSQFIEKKDYDASVHQDILDALTRSDENIVEICEDRAIAEMKGYLSGRYECDKIFGARGEERNQLVLMMAIDISVYHLFCIHNPRNMSQIRSDRYKRAVEWLKGVRRGDINVDGLPEREGPEAERSSMYLLRSNPKRINHI